MQGEALSITMTADYHLHRRVFARRGAGKIVMICAMR
jgi:hypothetical protein